MNAVVVRVLMWMSKRMSDDMVILNRDTVATMVPAGARIVLQKGTDVRITQDKGDSFTVYVYGNLARIEAQDADALGRSVKDPLADMPADASVEDKIWVMLKTCYDPEIPVNIVDLGLVYACKVDQLNDEQYAIDIEMTLTAPGCGMGPVIAGEAKQKILSIAEVQTVEIDIVFDPPWSRDRMSEAAKLELGLL